MLRDNIEKLVIKYREKYDFHNSNAKEAAIGKGYWLEQLKACQVIGEVILDLNGILAMEDKKEEENE